MINEFRRQHKALMEQEGFLYYDDTDPEPIRNIYKAINKKIGLHVGKAKILQLEISHLEDVVAEQEKKLKNCKKQFLVWDTVQHDK